MTGKQQTEYKPFVICAKLNRKFFWLRSAWTTGREFNDFFGKVFPIFCIVDHSIKAGEGMTCLEFWLSLFSIFLATLVAGTIIGSYIAWKISNNLANK